MDRKNFIASITSLGLAFKSNAENAVFKDNREAERIKMPHYLQKGDIIGITCPAGFLTIEELQPAKLKLEEWGFKVKIGTTVGTQHGTFAGTDAERLNDFQSMLDDTTVKAIMCGRGGYGCNRIIDALHFKQFKQKPKWIIGFSDITLLHTHVNTLLNTASIHSKMCNSFLTDWSKAEPLQMDSINSIKECLIGTKMKYTATANDKNKLGTANGVLVGGNLSIIYSAMKTKSELNTKGKILFLEEVGERLYSIDRMMWNLKRTGSLKHLKGLIIGGFSVKPAEKPENEFNETIYDIVHNVCKDYTFPICFDFPVGHQKANYALKCGVKHNLVVATNAVQLNEI